MLMNGDPLLTLMIFIPLLGMAVVLALPSRAHDLIRWTATAFSVPPLLLAVVLLARFAPGAQGFQFVHRATWIPAFNIDYFVGVDGISITMIVLTALLCFICMIASFGIDKGVKGYYALFLLLETGMLGVFCALDFFLFFVFWELMLLPMYFLIGVWGGPRREYAAIKFFLYTLLGSVLMLVTILYLYFASDPHSFDMTRLSRTAHVTMNVQLLLWLALFIGFAIKIPAFPFHTWLPDAHVEAPTAISVILAGVLLKMGTYGILRINYGILPAATLAPAWHGRSLAFWLLAALGTFNIVYGALAAMAQTDLKKLVAYSSISHMGYVMLGMAAFTPQGINGAVLQMFNHGTVTAMLFPLVGVIYDRAHHREIAGFGDLAVVGAVVDHADQQEEHRRHGAVVEHLEHGAVDPLRREGGHAEHHVAHVADARVGDQLLHVRLRHGAHRAVDDVEGAERGQQPEGEALPVPRRGERRRGQDAVVDAQDAVRPHLQEHAGEDDRDRG